jgi:hypothetical protein
VGVIVIDASTTRRASKYRRRAAKLAETARHIRNAADRRHLLGLAATYQHTADQTAPPLSTEFFCSRPCDSSGWRER